MGEHRVKNITEPVTVYRINLDTPGRAHRRTVWTKQRWHAAAVAVALLLVFGAGGAWYALRSPVPAPDATTAQGGLATAEEDTPALPLPDKPSMVVLPFTNLSSAPEQGYFADAVTEDIITGLARFRELFVISSNSSFRYKGQGVAIKKICRELGVRFALEGSVRRSEDRLRATVQLIDALTDEHLWAETYDRELTTANVFEVQDDITQQVVSELGSSQGRGSIHATIADSIQNKNADSFATYEFHAMAEEILRTGLTEAPNRAMREYYRKAIEKDPDFALAYAGLGWVEMRAYWGGWSSDPDESLQRALDYGLKALALDEKEADVCRRQESYREFSPGRSNRKQYQCRPNNRIRCN